MAILDVRMQKQRFDGHLMPFSTPFAGAVLPKELARPQSGKLLARAMTLEKASRKDAMAQSLAMTMHYKEPGFLASGLQIHRFPWRLCVFAAMNYSL